VAAERPGVLFVTTTNFPQAIDKAFLSRADLVLHLALPDEVALDPAQLTAEDLLAAVDDAAAA